ncbi:unnamed protein product [Parajaminaea phylloscopi]
MLLTSAGEAAPAQASDLPLELLPLILDQIHAANRPQDLAACARVCKTWKHWATPRLWQRLWLRDHRRLRPVFSTLRRNIDLCRFVRVLELRVYPLGLAAEDLELLEDDVATALAHMVNIEELSWTRTGSLSNRLLPFLVANKPNLTHLELMGNTRNWASALPLLWLPDPHAHLVADPFPKLRSISFVLPDSGAVRALVEISKRRKLESINILCQQSGLLLPVHADLLTENAGDEADGGGGGLENLKRLVLVGCKRIDGDSVRRLLKASKCGVRTLSLEDCAVHPAAFAALAPTLRSTLSTLTLTLPRSSVCSRQDFYQHLSELVQSLEHLRQFTLYAPGGARADGVAPDLEDDDTSLMDVATVSALPLSFLRALLTSKATGLPHRRLSMLRIHGIVCPLDGLQLIGQDASRSMLQDDNHAPTFGLQDLVVQLENGPLLTIIEHLLPLAPSLKTLHVLARAGAELVLHEEDVAWLARSLVRPGVPVSLGSLRQIGFRHRVWEVHRQLGPTRAGACSEASEQGKTNEEASHGAAPGSIELDETDDVFGAFDGASARSDYPIGDGSTR